MRGAFSIGNERLEEVSTYLECQNVGDDPANQSLIAIAASS